MTNEKRDKAASQYTKDNRDFHDSYGVYSIEFFKAGWLLYRAAEKEAEMKEVVTHYETRLIPKLNDERDRLKAEIETLKTERKRALAASSVWANRARDCREHAEALAEALTKYCSNKLVHSTDINDKFMQVDTGLTPARIALAAFADFKKGLK